MVKIVKTKGEVKAKCVLTEVFGRTIYLENLSLVTSIVVNPGEGHSSTYILPPSTATFKSFIEFENWDQDTFKSGPVTGSTHYYLAMVKDNPIVILLQRIIDLLEDQAMGVK